MVVFGPFRLFLLFGGGTRKAICFTMVCIPPHVRPFVGGGGGAEREKEEYSGCKNNLYQIYLDC
jgi:hypothetical protein